MQPKPYIVLHCLIVCYIYFVFIRPSLPCGSGQKGSVGSIGPPGVQGPAGPDGRVGDAGEPGLTGFTGPQGKYLVTYMSFVLLNVCLESQKRKKKSYKSDSSDM